MIASVLNLKGGTAKSTTAVNFGAWLALTQPKSRILMVDADAPQYTLGSYRKAIPRSRYATPEPTELASLLQGDDYDHAIIDCPPRTGTMQPIGVTALLHSDIVIVPLQTETDALQAAYATEALVDEIRPRNQRLMMFVLLTMFRPSLESNRSVRDQARTDFADTILKPIIPNHRDFSDAGYVRKAVVTFRPAGTGAKAYTKAFQEIMDSWQHRNDEE